MVELAGADEGLARGLNEYRAVWFHSIVEHDITLMLCRVLQPLLKVNVSLLP